MRAVTTVALLIALAASVAPGQGCPECRGCGGHHPATEVEDVVAVSLPGMMFLPDWTVASVSGTGDEAALLGALNRVLRWVATERLPMVGRPFVAFGTDPDEAPPESLRYTVAVPVPRSAAERKSGDMTMRTWGGFRVATGLHVGPREGLAAARARLREQVETAGWEVAGSAMEFLVDLPGQVEPDSLRTEVAYPVRRPDGR